MKCSWLHARLLADVAPRGVGFDSSVYRSGVVAPGANLVVTQVEEFDSPQHPARRGIGAI